MMFTLDVFTGNWEVPKENHTSSNLKGNTEPTRHAPRKVPIHLQDALHKKIRNLEQLEILKPVSEVTEWVN